MIKKALKYYLIASIWVLIYYILRELFDINFLRAPLVVNFVFGCAILFLIPFFIYVFRAINIYIKK